MKTISKRVHFFQVMLIVFMIIIGSANLSYAMGDYDGNKTGATWYWPVLGYTSEKTAFGTISSSYGFRGGDFNRNHYGCDVAVKAGTPIYPVRAGKVSYVKNSTSGASGRKLVVDHGDGYFSVYMHLSTINVKVGDSVNLYTKIGLSGGSGYDKNDYYKAHLHFGIHYTKKSGWTGADCNVNPCPEGYTRIGNSFKASNGGYPVGKASIAYKLDRGKVETPVSSKNGFPLFVELHDGAKVYKDPSSSGKVFKTVKGTDVVSITRKITLFENGIVTAYEALSDGSGYVKASESFTHSCSSKSCRKCMNGTTKYKEIKPTEYVTTKDTPVRYAPYADATSAYALAVIGKNVTISIDASITNSVGNTFYRIAKRGVWVYAGNIKKR